MKRAPCLYCHRTAKGRYASWGVCRRCYRRRNLSPFITPFRKKRGR
jgi:hypothetical protein